MKKLLLTTMLMLATMAMPFVVSARDYGWPTAESGQSWFTYVSADYDKDNEGYGTMMPDVYHVAIFIPTEMVASGSTVEALRFWMAARSVSDMSIWASTFLPEDGQMPDLCQTSFTYDDREQMERNGRLYSTLWYNIAFDKPVTIEGKGIYVGFSAKVDSISHQIINGEAYEYGWDAYPLAYITNGTYPYSFFLRSATRGQWSNWGESQGAQYLLGALISGAGREHAANVADFGTIYNVVGNQPKASVILSALGSAGINNIDYTVNTVGDTSPVAMHYDFDHPLAFGERTAAELPLPSAVTSGRVITTLTVTHVNGQPNEAEQNQSKGQVINLSKQLYRKPTVEEFNATWSGDGPRGIVARERMKINFPDQLVIIANHVNSSQTSDPMALDHYFEQAIGGDPIMFVPKTCINRIKQMDSYFGTTFGRANAIRLDLQKAVKELAPARMKLVANWDADESVITVNTSLNFFYSDNEATYALAYVLTENGMQGDTEEWNQQNAYAGQEWIPKEDWLFPWVQRRSSVSGVSYDDVAIAAWGIGGGLENSVPTTITEGNGILHTITYDADSNELLQDKTKLKMAVLLFNTETGEIVNAEQTHIISAEEAAGISIQPGIEPDKNAIYYDLQGRRVNVPQKGIYIVNHKKVLLK